MKPLSPFTYSRRHKRRTLLLVGLVAATTLGVCVMVRLLGFAVEQYETSLRYLTRVSEVTALGGALDPGVVAQIRAHPDVARAFPKKDLAISVPLNTSGGFPVFAVSEADLPFLMDACELRLKEGRLFAARASEILLSEEIAAVLGLQIGDPVGRAIDKVYHESIPTTVVLVGILESDPAERT